MLVEISRAIMLLGNILSHHTRFGCLSLFIHAEGVTSRSDWFWNFVCACLHVACPHDIKKSDSNSVSPDKDVSAFQLMVMANLLDDKVLQSELEDSHSAAGATPAC